MSIRISFNKTPRQDKVSAGWIDIFKQNTPTSDNVRNILCKINNLTINYFIISKPSPIKYMENDWRWDIRNIIYMNNEMLE